MLASCLLLLTGILFAQEETPRVVRERFEFRTFGEQTLKKSKVVVEAKPTSVILAGRGVSVAHFEVLEVFRGDATERELVVLTAPGQFSVGVSYLMFLDRFQESGRLTVVNRIARGERDFAAKLKVLREFLEADQIKDSKKRALEIRSILLKNVGDPELFIKWNALAELAPFVEMHRSLFGPAEKARLVEVFGKDASPTFRRELRRILEKLGIRIER
ncbi:MAG: hypothetical protein V2A76_09770 [Planctomycetota bacterium]